MRVVRLRAPGGPEQLAVEETDRPQPGPGEALVRVHPAAITRGELEWPIDRLPAIPSYELSGVVEEVGSGVASVAAGDEVVALTPYAETERLGGSAARETRTSSLAGASLSLSSICQVLRRVAS
jgi:NADPH:quinone reductase-like Zn-dependent oxidoreductase